METLFGSKPRCFFSAVLQRALLTCFPCSPVPLLYRSASKTVGRPSVSGPPTAGVTVPAGIAYLISLPHSCYPVSLYSKEGNVAMICSILWEILRRRSVILSDRLIRFSIFRAIGFDCRITGFPMNRNRSQRVSKLCKYRSSQSQLIVRQAFCKQ